MAHRKLESVRVRYQFVCGYCGISEVDAGGLLTIDHFVPISAKGGDDDDNLVYSCIRCNQYKAAYHAAISVKLDGRTLLHPLRNDLSSHLKLNEISGELEGLSVSGAFHISLLQLNRPALIAHRRRKSYWKLAELVHMTLLSEVIDLESTVANLTRQLAILEDNRG